MNAAPILAAAESIREIAARLRAERRRSPDDHVLTDCTIILDTVADAFAEAALAAEQRRVEAARSVA